MKKFLCVATSFLMALTVTACGSNGGDSNEGSSEAKAEVVMITDVGTIDDRSFNQGTWEGVQAYGDETGKSVDYIKPAEKSDNAYKEAIDQAVNDYGAKVVVTPGYLFEASIYEKQDQYPDVKFILLDGYPNDADPENPTYKTAKNTVGIKYAEQEAGYMAGYAIVKDGKTKLGFMGGMAVPAVMNFGFGFVQGANDAAEELGIKIDLKYKYTGSFTASPEIQSEAASWYKNEGVEVIFACGGAIGNSVMAAAEANDGLVIGVDVDQSGDSETVITSACKQLANSVVKELKAIDDGTFPGGEDLVLSTADSAIELPMENSKFEKFTNEDYETLYNNIKDGKIDIKNTDTLEDKNGDDVKDPTDITASNVNLDYIKN